MSLHGWYHTFHNANVFGFTPLAWNLGCGQYKTLWLKFLDANQHNEKIFFHSSRLQANHFIIYIGTHFSPYGHREKTMVVEMRAFSLTMVVQMRAFSLKLTKLEHHCTTNQYQISLMFFFFEIKDGTFFVQCASSLIFLM